MGVLKELLAANGPTEVIALLRYSRNASAARRIMTATLDGHWHFAYETLAKVSRSFALVIMQLRPELRHAVCVFYLVLRALDTVEDDTTVCATVRRQLCKSFWTFLPITEPMPSTPLSAAPSDPSVMQKECDQAIAKPKPTSSSVDTEECETIDQRSTTHTYQPWKSSQFGEGASKLLCERFDDVIACFRELSPTSQHIITDITRRMGNGMASQIDHTACDTIEEYDTYCHYVAGLVGYGLSDLFVQGGYESTILSDRKHLSNSMGIFLQKTNIIRDYLEDIEEARTFWPKQLWTQYGDRLEDFRDIANRKFSLAALNHMVTDALRHIPDCLEYMSLLRSKDVFNFVAIPQVMAIATLTECYNNGKVFEGVVKLRRARTALLVLRTRDMDEVYKLFFEYAHRMLQMVEPRDPNADATRHELNNVIEICVPHVPAAPNLIIPNVVSIVLFCGLSSYVLKRRQEHFDGAVFTWRSAGGIMEPTDMLAVGALFLVCMYMFGFFLLPYMTKLQQEEWRRLQRESNGHAHEQAQPRAPAPARHQPYASPVVHLNE